MIISLPVQTAKWSVVGSGTKDAGSAVQPSVVEPAPGKVDSE